MYAVLFFRAGAGVVVTLPGGGVCHEAQILVVHDCEAVGRYLIQKCRRATKVCSKQYPSPQLMRVESVR
jgi:hypothetical protein